MEVDLVNREKKILEEAVCIVDEVSTHGKVINQSIPPSLSLAIGKL